MGNVQFIQLTPQELAEMISKEVSSSLEVQLSELLNSSVGKEEKEYLSRKEVSEYLGVSYSCIRDWMKRGILSPYKIGNRTFFQFKEIKETLLKSKEYKRARFPKLAPFLIPYFVTVNSNKYTAIYSF